MRHIDQRSPARFLWLLLGTFLVGSLIGCSGDNSEIPSGDPEVRRKSKEDALKAISTQPKMKKSKGAPTKEDTF